MLKVIFTLDYEIHGNGEGSPHALMVEPTHRMLDLFDRYGAKLTIMADVAEILKFKEYQEQFGKDDYHYDAVAGQLRETLKRGHDVQLHLHSSYFNAKFKSGRWEQDWSEYNFASLPFGRLNEMVRVGKQYLEDWLKPVDSRYECMAFRAANWSVSPSRNVVRALIENNIRVETSVFKYGRRDGIVKFDYSNAPSELEPWPVDEDDICRRNANGKLMESPIYCERRWLGAFLTPNRLHRVLMREGRAFGGPSKSNGNGNGAVRRVSLAQKIGNKLTMPARRHAWKADFNQCTGRQLTAALKRCARRHDPDGLRSLPFVLIGHSKLFTRANERSLATFLAHVAENPKQFQFGTFRSEP